MAAGATLDEVLHGMKHREHLGAIETMIALRTMSPMSLVCAKGIVSTWCEGTSCAHVTLAERDVLGDVPRTGGVEFFVRCERDAAILAREPYLLYAAAVESSTHTRLFRSATRLRAPRPGHRGGPPRGRSCRRTTTCARPWRCGRARSGSYATSRTSCRSSSCGHSPNRSYGGESNRRSEFGSSQSLDHDQRLR
jgi:hypothetical protein